jgi:tetratricopeptide (TPR) repeat protein
MNLGSTYLELPTNDQQAKNSCEAALQIFTSRDYPTEWAKTQINLGRAYQKLSSGDHHLNLQKAITCYQSALPILLHAGSPVELGYTLHRLGTAYYELRMKGQNYLEQSIACYKAALDAYTGDFPIDLLGEIMKDLGDAYRNFSKGDRQANLEVAITSYQASQKAFPKEDYPIEWAKIENNLGIAYSQFSKGDKQANLRTAINCFQAARQVFCSKHMDDYIQSIDDNISKAQQVLQRLS